MTARGVRSFDYAQLKDKVDSVDLQHVSTKADLVVDGTIVSVETEPINGPDSSSATLVRITMKVDRVLKGRFDDPEIVVMGYAGGVYLPSWATHVPPPWFYKTGQRWLCSLTKEKIGWYLFAGTNGFLRIENDKLVYDERVEFWHSLKEVEQAAEHASGGR